MTQHVQYPGAFVIHVPIKELEAIPMIDVIDDWPAIVMIFAEVAMLQSEHRLLEIIAAEVVLVPQLLKGGGEAFIQPAIWPVPAGHKITKALLRQFMRHDAYIS